MPREPFSWKKRTACHGLTEASTAGCCTICTTPSRAIVPNQTSVMGPNTAPTPPVPRRWKAKSPTRIATVRGSTQGVRLGTATSSPSTALSTEMAGVIMLSPYRRAAPNSPTSTSACCGVRPRIERWRGITRAVSAMIPPSPRLSARMTSARYFRTITTTSDQKMSDRMPYVFACVAAMPCEVWNDSRIA